MPKHFWITLITLTLTTLTVMADTGEAPDEEPLCLTDPDGVPYPCFPWVNCPGAPKAPPPPNCDNDGNCWCGEDGGEGPSFKGREVTQDIDGRPILPVPFSCHIVHGNAGICGMSCGESDGRRTVISVCKETTCNGEPCLDCDGYAIKKYVAGTCHG